MAKRSTYKDLFVITLARYKTKLEPDGEDIETRCIQLTIDSLSIEEYLFVKVVDSIFPKNEVHRPRIGRATLDLFVPIIMDDQVLVERVAESIGQVAELILLELAETPVE